MTQSIGVAEAKRRFSELTSKTLYRGERFIIARKGKPVAAMVSIDDLKRIEAMPPASEKRGLLAAVGAWSDYENLDKVVSEIYESRERAVDRPVAELE